MAERYGQGFQRPVDFFTGKPFPGAPEMATIRNNLHGPNGHVILRDTNPPAPPPPENKARVTDNEPRPLG